MEQDELELLNNIYRNAEMGRDGLYFVLRKTDDTTFRKLVETQLMEYQNVMDEAEQKLRAGRQRPTGKPGLREDDGAADRQPEDRQGQFPLCPGRYADPGQQHGRDQDHEADQPLPEPL